MGLFLPLFLPYLSSIQFATATVCCCCGRSVSEIPGREHYWFVDCFHGDRIGSFTDCLWLDNRCEQFVCTLFFAGFFNCTDFGAASCSTWIFNELRSSARQGDFWGGYIGNMPPQKATWDSRPYRLARRVGKVVTESLNLKGTNGNISAL